VFVKEARLVVAWYVRVVVSVPSSCFRSYCWGYW